MFMSVVNFVREDKPDIFKINQPKKVPINPYLSRLITLETSFAVTKLMNS